MVASVPGQLQLPEGAGSTRSSSVAPEDRSACLAKERSRGPHPTSGPLRDRFPFVTGEIRRDSEAPAAVFKAPELVGVRKENACSVGASRWKDLSPKWKK